VGLLDGFGDGENEFVFEGAAYTWTPMGRPSFE